MKHLTLAACVTDGTVTARGKALASGAVLRDSMGAGALSCEGLLKSLGSHRELHAMSFARSVTVLEKRHHNGGFGVPANGCLMAMQAATNSTAIDCAAAAAVAESSLWSCLAINSAWSSPHQTFSLQTQIACG
jgi:hypothetical protein